MFKLIALATLKGAKWWPLGWLLDWFVFAPLYSTHSRLWDFVLILIMTVFNTVSMVGFMYWRLTRLVKQGRL